MSSCAAKAPPDRRSVTRPRRERPRGTAPGPGGGRETRSLQRPGQSCPEVLLDQPLALDSPAAGMQAPKCVSTRRSISEGQRSGASKADVAPPRRWRSEHALAARGLHDTVQSGSKPEGGPRRLSASSRACPGPSGPTGWTLAFRSAAAGEVERARGFIPHFPGRRSDVFKFCFIAAQRRFTPIVGSYTQVIAAKTSGIRSNA